MTSEKFDCENSFCKTYEEVEVTTNSKIKYEFPIQGITAVSCLKRALWTSPLNWRVLFNLGLVHLSIHQPASAFIFLCAAVNLRSDVPQSFTALGYCLMELQDPENAIRACIHAANLSPDIVDHQLNTALCSLRAGNLELLQESLQRVELLMSTQEHISSECSDLFKYLSKASIIVDRGKFTEGNDEAFQRLNSENEASEGNDRTAARQDAPYLNMESDEV
ncbi:hypothetical protein WA026_007900 [Henosepilachna vigintioctopunctata]|uniref:Uncharacterized protein n=1 Tax=Henosepilachna vigintioctopunctata TaxID=420089 RepID=A0AAW1U6H1_9CUCU